MLRIPASCILPGPHLWQKLQTRSVLLQVYEAGRSSALQPLLHLPQRFFLRALMENLRGLDLQGFSFTATFVGPYMHGLLDLFVCLCFVNSFFLNIFYNKIRRNIFFYSLKIYFLDHIFDKIK